jgi:hypothetical protein
VWTLETMDNTDLIDSFVKELNSDGLEPLFAKDVPQELRTRELPEIPDMFFWEIRPANDNSWVSTLEEMLPCPFPALYRGLITRFRFAEFEIGPIMFFANTGEQSVFHDLTRCLFADKGLYPVLLENGYLQFGQQVGGGYDPVCFDMKRRRDADAPIVQLDHEDILIRNRVRVLSEVAPSFHRFAEQAIAGEFSRRR